MPTPIPLRQRPAAAYEFPVERGVPVPKTRTLRRYPFSLLDVGDSFFVPGGNVLHMRSCAGWHQRKGKRFTVRAADGGARVWRVS